jgi:putative transposase
LIRTFRYPLRPTREQEKVLLLWSHRCCELYNAALQERRDAWRKQRVSVTRYDQHKELTELRQIDPEWRSIPTVIARSAFARLDQAFQAFFRRVRRSEKPGFPRFRSRDRYDSFNLGSDVPRIEGNRVRFPKLGFVRFKKYREMQGEIRTVRVHREARSWSISFVCDIGDAPSKVAVKSAVGVDVGLEAFATMSTGERVENPRFFRKAQDVLARRQRSLAEKRRDSNSRKRARRLVARAHEHVKNQRLDFARKLACALFARFDLVAYEDLAISRMVRGNLAKSIHDAAWGRFLSALTCKAEGAGKYAIAVDPRGTSQTCPRCGTVATKTLDQREHHCACGFVAHRDHAAAQVILGRGLRLGQLTEAGAL